MSDKPQWNFPPTNGGVDYVNDPSSAYFSDSPIPKLVREVIQNSLDAKDDRFDEPVAVRFSEMEIERKHIGGADLSKHIASCLLRAENDKRADAVASYRNALKVSRRARIRCLKIQDTGTTGLVGFHWDALVRQEGAVNKSAASAGGSFGIGKNAVFNVSDLHTVFYCTRYVEGRRGRVDLLQGKAALMAHPNPQDPKDMLQHMGFYACEGGEPISGRKAMPNCFELDETGAGVFIMGFNPRSSGSQWAQEVALAAADNFFYAIHNRRLRVEVAPLKGKAISVNHETLASLFNGYGADKSESAYFYRAIRDAADSVERTEPLGELGRLNAYALFTEGAPRRAAYINRKGMLITQSNELSANPLRPRNRTIWPEYAVVVMADTDAGDGWIRKMENPSHDSISPNQLGSEKEIREARNALSAARRALRELIDAKADIQQYGDESNLDELAHLFRDELDPKLPGSRELPVQKIETKPRPTQVEEYIQPDDSSEDEDEINAYENKRTRKRRRKDNENAPVRPRLPSLMNPRFIPKSSREAIVAFTTDDAFDGIIRLALAPAGADRLPSPGPLRPPTLTVTKAEAIGDAKFAIKVENGAMAFQPPPNERVVINVVAENDIDRYAITLREARDD